MSDIQYVMVMHDGSRATKFMSEDYCKDLMEQLAAAQSGEVCTKPHADDVLKFCQACKIESLQARLAEAERNEGTLLGMIRHQRDVLRECLPYLNESMAGRRPGRSADDIRAAVKALTTDSAASQPSVAQPWDRECVKCGCKWIESGWGAACPRCEGNADNGSADATREDRR